MNQPQQRWTRADYRLALEKVGADPACPSCRHLVKWEVIRRTNLSLIGQEKADIPMVVSICADCGFRREHLEAKLREAIS